MDDVQIPQFSFENPTMPSMGPPPASIHGRRAPQLTDVYILVQDVRFAERRDHALKELSKCREDFPNLGPLLWHSFGTIASLIHEIVMCYPKLEVTEELTKNDSDPVCNALALLQCVASHPDTRQPFLQAHIPELLHPFLRARAGTDRSPSQNLQLTSLGVIGAVVKEDAAEVVDYFVDRDIVYSCVSIMKEGNDLPKTVATYIVHRIMSTDNGFRYVCCADWFWKLVETISEILHSQAGVKLLKHVLRCYRKVAENPQACHWLRHNLPPGMAWDPEHQDLPEPYRQCINDPLTKQWWHQHLLPVTQQR